MAKKLFLLALIFFAAVSLGAAAAPATESIAPSSEDKGGVHPIGSVSEGSAADAAPVGGPVPAGVFPNLTPAPAPGSGAASLQVSTVAGVVAVAGVVGSFFF